MKVKFSQPLSILIIIFLTSCGQSEQQIKEEKDAVVKQKSELLKTTNEKAITDLSKKYNSVSGWDTLELYTYNYQEMFIDEGKPINFEGKLKDIIKSDSIYYLKVHNTGWHYHQNYIAQISVTPQKFLEFQKILKSANHTNEGCFIFKVTKIVSASPEIKSDLELDGEDSYSYLDYEFDETLLIFKGELIDFYFNETADKTND